MKQMEQMEQMVVADQGPSQVRKCSGVRCTSSTVQLWVLNALCA
jgi:hypothetical protein